jgi:dTDP-4-amino-4,6-dideoxygalactose transaminase
MHDLSQIIIEAHETLRTSLQRLNTSGRTVLLLIDETGRFCRTLTDGDIRRLLLSGAVLDDSLETLPPHESHTADPGLSPEAVLAMMDLHSIDQVPVIDGDGRPLNVHLRRELDHPILLSTPHLSEHERGFVEDAFATNWIAPIGPNVDAFERELADKVGVAHAAALSSGTAAIHLALKVLGIGEGDRVFTSSLTFVATANPILYVGAEPVFIDSEPETWNMSPAALARALDAADHAGTLPKAVMPVGLYGQSPDMAAIVDLCARYDIPIIEDAAESLGATYNGEAAGTFGRLGVYSFNGNKIITTSGGGMLVSDDGALIERARFLATQAREQAPWYEHRDVGFNYRMSNILAGIGRGQLKVLDERVAQRRSVFDRYVQALEHVDGLTWMGEPTGHRASRWLSVATLDTRRTGIDPTSVIEHLASQRIEARRVWKPMHLQPLFADNAYWPHHDGESVSEHLFKVGLCLPSGSNLTRTMQQRVTDQLASIFNDSQNVHSFHDARAG